MHSTFSSLALVTVFSSILTSAYGWPALSNGFNMLNRRQSDSSVSYYTTIYNTETVTDTLTDILTATLPATDTTTFVTGSPSFSGAAHSGVPLSPEPSSTTTPGISSTTTTVTPEPITTATPLYSGSPSFTSAPDSGMPFPQMSNSTYSLITTTPPRPTGIVCVENDYLQALQNFSIDATPFCSSYLSIPNYTVTYDSATVYKYIPFIASSTNYIRSLTVNRDVTTTITEQLIDATSTTTVVSATVTSTTTVVEIRKRNPEPTPAPAVDAFAQSSLSELAVQCSTEPALLTSLSAACSCLFLKPSTQTIYATAFIVSSCPIIQ